MTNVSRFKPQMPDLSAPQMPTIYYATTDDLLRASGYVVSWRDNGRRRSEEIGELGLAQMRAATLAGSGRPASIDAVLPGGMMKPVRQSRP